MQDIEEFTGDNIGGIESFMFIPVDDVISIARPVDQTILELVVINEAGGAQWFNAYVTQGSLSYRETQNKTKQGHPYSRTLAGFVPKDTESLAALFNEMCYRKFLGDYTYNNGKIQLIGSIDSPLLFDTELETKDDPAGRNGHRISFASNSPHKAYFYNPPEGSASGS